MTHSTREIAKTMRLVHRAAQRALLAITSSVPRTVMMNNPPARGSQVSRDRIGKPAALVMVRRAYR